MNKIIVIGNLGRDPEMRYTPGGQGFTSFSVAVSAAGTPPAPESSGKPAGWRGCLIRREARA